MSANIRRDATAYSVTQTREQDWMSKKSVKVKTLQALIDSLSHVIFVKLQNQIIQRDNRKMEWKKRWCTKRNKGSWVTHEWRIPKKNSDGVQEETIIENRSSMEKESRAVWIPVHRPNNFTGVLKQMRRSDFQQSSRRSWEVVSRNCLVFEEECMASGVHGHTKDSLASNLTKRLEPKSDSKTNFRVWNRSYFWLLDFVCCLDSLGLFVFLIFVFGDVSLAAS